MEKLTEQQKKILKVFYDEQCDEDDGLVRDECSVVRYSTLEHELKTTKDRLKPDIIELRNMGIIWLAMAVDCDYIPSGSGYILTEPKGESIVRELFLTCRTCDGTGEVTTMEAVYAGEPHMAPIGTGKCPDCTKVDDDYEPENEI